MHSLLYCLPELEPVWPMSKKSGSGWIPVGEFVLEVHSCLVKRLFEAFSEFWVYYLINAYSRFFSVTNLFRQIFSHFCWFNHPFCTYLLDHDFWCKQMYQRPYWPVVCRHWPESGWKAEGQRQRRHLPLSLAPGVWRCSRTSASAPSR